MPLQHLCSILHNLTKRFCCRLKEKASTETFASSKLCCLMDCDAKVFESKKKHFKNKTFPSSLRCFWFTFINLIFLLFFLSFTPELINIFWQGDPHYGHFVSKLEEIFTSLRFVNGKLLGVLSNLLIFC